ncbi:hypothetical protein [Azohydromonas lata]|uniref:hypothetical protein n=1 Tax=Azohydromonas lata TaxID=45677 RepID=UPI000830AFFA|nr:hypothetical protein [Azohydromonas lata]
MSSGADILDRNRVLLTHFDSYSAALLFARWGKTVLAPAALPDGATPMEPPAVVAPTHEPEAVRAAIAQKLNLSAAELNIDAQFNQWFQAEGGPVRVHLLRFNTFEAPKKAIAETEGVFKPISEMRGGAKEELSLAREVFNLTLGAPGGRAC